MKKETNNTKAGYEKVYIYKDSKDNDPVLNVIINGTKYSVPKDKEVYVPSNVAMVIKQSQNQMRLAQRADELAQQEQVFNM